MSLEVEHQGSTERIERAEFRVLDRFRGDPPVDLTVRYRLDGCTGRPPLGEIIYLFVFEVPGSATAGINYISIGNLPSEFYAGLGQAGRPRPGSMRYPPSLHRLAPADIPATSIERRDGDIATERWTVQLQPVRQWSIPRFYVRLPNAFVFFDPAAVRTAAQKWGDPDLQREVEKSLPLKTPTDLYQFTLVGRMPRAAPNPSIEAFMVDSLLAGSAIVRTNSGYARSIRVTRTELGKQTFATEDGTEFLTSEWGP